MSFRFSNELVDPNMARSGVLTKALGVRGQMLTLVRLAVDSGTRAISHDINE
ncbi:hypothetical protein NSU_pLA1042 (plasmid) [Novosphingobium pentaromativorans US6-1]|uniref:Uncharacterized protein n=1 Tax=Novosphingobium pentaromativorans US6-1 TaxID=1088721 RepID=G6EKW9_9SPHN|nr:hypothetical protein NSU_pLA1042 [Novosphingobium pentaromativorans US6-1]